MSDIMLIFALRKTTKTREPMPEHYHYGSFPPPPPTPKQLKAKMDKKAKKVSEHYRLIVK